MAPLIRRVKGVKQLGHRTVNWLTAQQGQQLLNAPDRGRLRGKADAAMLALVAARLRAAPI